MGLEWSQRVHGRRRESPSPSINASVICRQGRIAVPRSRSGLSPVLDQRRGTAGEELLRGLRAAGFRNSRALLWARFRSAALKTTPIRTNGCMCARYPVTGGPTLTYWRTSM